MAQLIFGTKQQIQFASDSEFFEALGNLSKNEETHSETNLFSTKKWVPLKKVIPQLAIEDKKYYFSQRAVEGMKNAKNNMKRGLYQDLDFTFSKDKFKLS